ncbi:MAG: GAF domain-containing sensor histidine kinase [Bacteroidota bacterium]|nr:GAF domain-containing sensor histidine kinase [Bacteroidota bacterium]
MKNTFNIPIVPENDEQRLNVLKRYEILDTPPEQSFNRIAELAIKMFKVPIALVSLVDKENVYFKANVGMGNIKTIDRGISLCSLAILRDTPTVFENSTEEPCLLANPLVTGSFGLRFYAGAPIVTSDGFNIGTVCIVDKIPREFSENDTSMLQDLAGIVMDELEVRLSAIKALRAKSEIMHIAAHDLKNPLFNIQALCDMLFSEKKTIDKEKVGGMIKESSRNMVTLIDRLVKLSEIENTQFALDLKMVNTADIAKEVVRANQIAALNKKQHINLNVQSGCHSILDKGWITEVFDNLINNAIKYSPPEKTIEVLLKTDDTGLHFEVMDEGLGFSEKDKLGVFKTFSKLSSKPTGGETSTGLGLSIVKTLVELHKGTVQLESEGKGKGSRFIVKIPAQLEIIEA